MDFEIYMLMPLGPLLYKMSIIIKEYLYKMQIPAEILLA